MPVYRTTFEVHASAETVWQVLTTLNRYGEWNPQIPRATGAIAEQAEINLCLVLPGRPAMNLVATIEQVRPGELLTWRGHVLAPWLFEGHRTFAIHAAGDRHVSVTHIEDIHGLLAPVFELFMGGPSNGVTMRSTTRSEPALRIRSETIPLRGQIFQAIQQPDAPNDACDGRQELYVFAPGGAQPRHMTAALPSLVKSLSAFSAAVTARPSPLE